MLKQVQHDEGALEISLSRAHVGAKETEMATQVAEKTVLGLDNPMGTDGFEFVE